MTDKKIIEKLKDDKHYYGDFGKQFLSNSDIQNLVLEPRQFHAPQPDNKNFVDGRYFHQLILEPEKVKDFKVCDVSSRNSKAYKEFLIDNNLEYAMLERETHNLKNMRDYMLGNLQFSDFINDPSAEYEVPATKEIMGIEWKGKADIVTDTHVFDIKTSSDVFKFPRNSINYFYHTQAYIYQELFQKQFNDPEAIKITGILGLFFLKKLQTIFHLFLLQSMSWSIQKSTGYTLIIIPIIFLERTLF